MTYVIIGFFLNFDVSVAYRQIPLAPCEGYDFKEGGQKCNKM